jgi:poly-gamma-glutamate capsule biosynthesis protein CapA/YwtB (metallophosphatase superfamily)
MNEKNIDFVSILIGGDVYPGNRYRNFFESGKIKSIFGELLNDFESADYRIVNLESPLILTEKPIIKSGPVLGATTDCINGFIDSQIDLVNLANNHILDHGEEGLKTTINTCRAHGISFVGAGKNRHDASKIFIKDINGIKLGVLSIAEHEFSIATEINWGAAPLDLIDNKIIIEKSKHDIDYLIILFHGGNEHYQYPSPRMKKYCRYFIDIGANAVLVQHTHCIGCYEYYNNGHIIYGQGNLIFDLNIKYKTFYEGMLVLLKIFKKNGSSTVTFIPFYQTKGELGIVKMQGNDLDAFYAEFNKRSLNVMDDLFINDQWKSFCLQKKQEYLSYLLGHNKIIRYLAAKNIFKNLFNNSKMSTSIRNVILCESHLDVLSYLFENNMITPEKRNK